MSWNPWAGLRAALTWIVPASYPFLVLGLTLRWGPPAAAFGVAAAATLVLILQRSKSPGARTPAAWLPSLFAALLAGMALVFRSSGWVRLTPALVSVSLGVVFAASLVRGTPLIERFARLQHPDLTDLEARWCRMWTWVWLGFLALNVAAVSVLAWAAPVLWWAAYTGGIAYLLMGSLFTIEYAGRVARFERYRNHPVRRGLGWLSKRLS